VEAGTPLARSHASRLDQADGAEAIVRAAFGIGDAPYPATPLVIERIAP